MPHKNICDFAGNDRDGNLHNKSSHAPVKTANKFSLYYRIPTCITCQVTLSVRLRLFFYYIFKEPLAFSASHAVVVGAFAPRFGLPSVRSSVLPSGATRHPFHKVHSGVLEFGSDHSKAEEENPKVVPRAFGVVRPLGFGAGALGVEGFGGNCKAKLNVGLDLSGVGRSVEKAELNRSRSPNVVEVDGAVAS